ncbi:hypothetical protein CUMW_024060 [Citrus unshiu]|nr:hypothetical protein CUMW_024060 [Citrus unshiu]
MLYKKIPKELIISAQITNSLILDDTPWPRFHHVNQENEHQPEDTSEILFIPFFHANLLLEAAKCDMKW